MSRLTSVKSTSLYDSTRDVYVQEWDFKTFASVPQCPIQRNHTIRLNKPHLRNYSPTHRNVAVAVLPSGLVYKLDGHSRVYAVENGQLPELLSGVFQVSIYSVANMNEVYSLYHAFDSTGASKTAADTVQSGLTMCGIELITPWMAAGRFGSMLSMAAKVWLQANPPKAGIKMTQIEKVELFKEEIVMLDALEPSKGRFLQGVGAGALLAFKKHGGGAQDFFLAYNSTEGLEAGSERNAVRMLHEYLNGLRKDGRTAGAAVNDDQFARTLALFSRHVANPAGFWTNQPSPMRPIDFART